MTNKLKQSTAVERQIPEHVRTNYPLFVEFVKVYYDFLEASQGRQLENIRDIDKSLDEFIKNFKSELANNLPIDMSSDKRLLLKHIREFYLARGSEASYQFLFRTLFGKEATLYYPSAQMLRVSDGRWKQDISVFVKVSDASMDLFILSGKFVKIKSGRKTIQTFVENVLLYDSDVYEVFIQRDYANDIVVGATVSLDEGATTYSGTIVKCPSKLTIYKPGKGFKVGQLFALNTQIGRGCVVKITKVGSNGEIRGIQPISFGLDYETTFYSYLSNKDIQSYEYIHPLKISSDGVPPGIADPSYNERSGGFIDYGWASKQTYMDYDESIPVGSLDRRSDRYYADSSYVGDIVKQFYTDQTAKVYDEDLAIIQIDLGAVARYPGYYMTVDGFISDEMYIQDGSYYQSFSYVIKVEEELRKYAEVVRALLHPAGMKMFAEYNIFRELKLTLAKTLVTRVLQLPVDGHRASLSIPQDAGYNYNSYDLESIVDGVTTYVPSEGASRVFSKQSKAAYFVTKLLLESLDVPDMVNSKFVEKPIDDTQSNSDAQAKFVSKPLADSLSEYLEAVSKFVAKTLSDVQSNSDAIAKVVDKTLSDSQANTDATAKGVQKPIVDITDEMSDVTIKEFAKVLADSQTNEDAQLKSFDKALASVQSTLNDAQSKDYVKSIEDSQLNDDAQTKSIDKPFADSQVNEDAQVKTLSKPFADIMAAGTFIDSYIGSFEKVLADSQALSDDRKPFDIYKTISESVTELDLLVNEYSKLLVDSQSLTDAYSNQPELIKQDSVSTLSPDYIGLLKYPTTGGTGEIRVHEMMLEITETFEIIRAKLFDDILQALSDARDITPIKNISETVAYADASATTYTKPLPNDNVSNTDTLSNVPAKQFITTMAAPSDTRVDAINKGIVESTTTSMQGRIRLSSMSYDDTGTYFDSLQDYQTPQATIS